MTKRIYLRAALSFCALSSAHAVAEETSFADAIKKGDSSFSVRHRFADIQQEGTEDATANTIRIRLGYETKGHRGFSGVIQYEQVAELFDVDYSDGITDRGTARIGDPEITELNQGYLQYKNDDIRVRVGRQIFTLDNKRFIGSSSWRQNERSYDGLTAIYTPLDALSLSYAHIANANPASGINQDADDHIFNVKYQFNDLITLTGYGYFIELVNAEDPENDTIGASLSGKTEALSYRVEYAQQDTDTYSADYFTVQANYTIGDITLGFGHEILGADGTNGELEILRGNRHGAQGWADKFTNTPDGGLADTYFSIGSNIGKVSGKLIYHDFESDDDNIGAGDLGSEIDAVVSFKTGSVKFDAIYAGYMADNFARDTRKFWLLTEFSF